ncbi:MAG: hypothetical protein B6244_09530 [Candidatus Cloacimonetes bacterium 4572_55]|nr:MAG: hypothetical protein B6244_09530 [Candidatus Cloacimonetes bacterium 4572_55]
MRKVVSIVFILFFVIYGSVSTDLLAGTQYYPSTDRFPINLQEMGGLLNPNQFDMSHQAQFFYASGSDGLGQMTGLFVSTLNYQLNSSLKVQLHLGYKNQPSDYNSFGQDSGVIPGASLLYQLNPDHLLGFSYGVTENNSFIYQAVDHSEKPLHLWYQGSFLNQSLKVNVSVANSYYHQSRNSSMLWDNPWFPSDRSADDPFHE